MDTERWQILLKAIDHGSLRAAAEEMGFTVSGISRSVATLERSWALPCCTAPKRRAAHRGMPPAAAVGA